MKKATILATNSMDEVEANAGQGKKQKALLRTLTRTVQHFWGNWETIFAGIKDARNPNLIQYPLTELLCEGVLMYLFRLGSRREVNSKLREEGPSTDKFKAWFGVDGVAHGDTLNYGFKRLDVDEVQEVVCRMVETLIRKKVLYPYRLLGVYFLVAIDGSGVLTFHERHCEHCLTRKLSNGELQYYHPVLEAKLVTSNGFAFSLMTEFIENSDPQAKKQDCELKAFYRLAERLKARFPRLPICLLMDGLFAGGPTFQRCEKYNWKYAIVLTEDDLPNVQRSFTAVLPHLPENHRQKRLGKHDEIVQTYTWAEDILYQDSDNREHRLNVIQCLESKPGKEQIETTRFKWLTNFTLTRHNVPIIANEGGRLRWNIENQGFNVQKNGGYNLEHPYSQHQTARKVFYFLLQIAHILFQLVQKGSLLSESYPKIWISAKDLAFRLLEAWRNLSLSTDQMRHLPEGKYQIRFNTS